MPEHLPPLGLSPFRRALLVVVGGVCSVSLLTSIGYAAPLPLHTDDLFAVASEDRPLVDVVVDEFTGDGNLNNRVPATAPVGSSWSVDASRFRTRFGTAQSRQNPTSRATIDIDRSDDFLVTTEVERLGRSDHAGLVFLGTTSSYLFATYDELTDFVELRSSVGGPALAVSAALGNPTSYVISVAVDQPSLTVRIDGAIVISYSMTPAEIASFGANTRAGLIAESRNTRFEFFTVVQA